jgi:DNA processing protein
VRGRIAPLLALNDAELIASVAGRDSQTVARELESFRATHARETAARAGLELICRCEPAYPCRLVDLASAPAVLYVAGGVGRLLELCELEPVAIVGSRRASSYGVEFARSLGRGLASAGVPVISGMAVGIDSAAHGGALSAGALTLAVLPGSAASPYPASKRALHRAITTGGAALSEMGPGSQVRRWMFPARNRLIAALGAMTVVVEAGERSGALLTAELARTMERPVGAVPGRVDSPLAAGPNELLARGAAVVRGPQDVVDLLFGAGALTVTAEQREPLRPELQMLLDALAAAGDTSGALANAGLSLERGLAALAELELAGYVRRVSGGRYAVVR